MNPIESHLPAWSIPSCSAPLSTLKGEKALSFSKQGPSLCNLLYLVTVTDGLLPSGWDISLEAQTLSFLCPTAPQLKGLQ